MRNRSHARRSASPKALACATLAVSLASCREAPNEPAPGSEGRGVSGALGGTVSDGSRIYACNKATPTPLGAAHRYQYSIVRFRYPRAAIVGSSGVTNRKLLITNADGDTVAGATCLVPNTRLGLALSDAVFDNLARVTATPPARAQRRNGITTLQLTARRAHTAAGPREPLGAPVCLRSGDCVVLEPAAPSAPVSLSIQYGGYTPPSWPSPRYDPYDPGCRYDSFYGCDYSQGNGGGGGDYWDEPPSINDNGIEFTCPAGSPSCLKELNANQRAMLTRAVALFKPDAELRLISAACANAAFAISAHLQANMIYTGWRSLQNPQANLGSNGLPHLAETGINRTAGSPTQGSYVVHVEDDFLYAVLTGTAVGGLVYTEQDLANVLLHEGMHLWNEGLTYQHGQYDTVPLSTAPFNLVNPKSASAATSLSCIK
jgi:hypothetical protein